MELAELSEKTRLEIRRKHEPEVYELLAAGWLFEVVSESATEPWQLAWRSPPKRNGSGGRRYASTGQAINALRRMKGGAT